MTPTRIQHGDSRPCTGCGAPFNPDLYRGATGPGIDVPPGHPAVLDDNGRPWHEGCALKARRTRQWLNS